ncbi:MAG: esterase family protein [Lentisphaeraceae bacterium]|nr:esterase family protein [Lentisphaeraceae bacterium]
MTLKLLLVCALLPFFSSAAEKDRSPKIIWNNIPKGKLPNGVQHLTFFSKSAKQDVGYSIYLPPSYKTNTDKRYPVIYNLHGNGGNELRGIFIAEILEKGIKAKKWPEMIIVFPNGGHSTFYKDSYDGKFPIETMFIKELIPHIDNTYRTIAEGKGRCIEGFSMGGRGSTRLAMKYPKMFCSLFCQAGNVPKTAENFDPNSPDVHPNSYLGPNKQNYIDNDAYLLLKKNIKDIKGKMRILIACGTKDLGHLITVRTYHQALLSAKVDHTYIELEGLDHKLKKMIKLMPNWFDYHAESLRRSGAIK